MSSDFKTHIGMKNNLSEVYKFVYECCTLWQGTKDNEILKPESNIHVCPLSNKPWQYNVSLECTV